MNKKSFRIVSYCCLALFAFGCSDQREPDSKYYGYVTVLVLPNGGELTTLRNGDLEVQLLTDENTEFVNFAEVNGVPAVSFDSVYLAEGNLNMTPDWMKNEDGTRIEIVVSNAEDSLWVTRLERLEPEAAKLLVSEGIVVEKK